MHISPPNIIVRIATVVLGMLVLFLLAQTLKVFKEYRYIGSGVTASNTITVQGQGEVFAVPDRATFSVTVREEAKEVADAQDKATKKANDIISYLKGAGVAEKDIKTVSYNVNPKYTYEQSVCKAGYCPPGKQILDGFEVYQSLEVKVQDPKKAGELLSGVGSKGASEVSGLSFTIEDEDALKAQAREQAIGKARAKADQLAKQLGVSVVRVVGFSEDSGGREYYAKAAMAYDSSAGLGGQAAPAPELPAGENKISSNVNITYEIH